MREALRSVQKIVVKAGTSILTSPKGRIRAALLGQLGGGIFGLIREKKEVVLVSSGAIAFGMEACGRDRRPKEMSELQACAAIGQGKLMHAYEQFFSRKGLHTAQLLLTRDGLETRTRFLRARQTMKTLLAMKDAGGCQEVLPIVNENDTVATEEIAFGDNDILAVHVAHLVHADLLVILSDVNGFHLRDGNRLRQVVSIREIEKELVHHLKDRLTQKTVGGMRAKLAAARAAMRLDIPLLLVNGHEPGVLNRALSGEDIGTLFQAREEKG